MIRTIVRDKDKLRGFCAEVDFEDAVDKVRASRIAGDLLDTLKTQKTGVGLAAPQIGQSRRIFVFQKDGKNIVAINPKLVSVSKGKIAGNEQCLSCPGADKRIFRHMSLVASWHDADGKSYKMKLKGLPAIIFQHEYDHLNGVLITDY